MGDLGINRRKILNWIFKKYNVRMRRILTVAVCKKKVKKLHVLKEEATFPVI